MFTPAHCSGETLEGFATQTLSEDDNKENKGHYRMVKDNNMID
jgi:hypothetical protein